MLETFAINKSGPVFVFFIGAGLTHLGRSTTCTCFHRALAFQTTCAQLKATFGVEILPCEFSPTKTVYQERVHLESLTLRVLPANGLPRRSSALLVPLLVWCPLLTWFVSLSDVPVSICFVFFCRFVGSLLC